MIEREFEVWEELEGEEEFRFKCDCRYCYCLNETDGGMCGECYMGAHQG